MEAWLWGQDELERSPVIWIATVGFAKGPSAAAEGYCAIRKFDFGIERAAVGI